MLEFQIKENIKMLNSYLFDGNAEVEVLRIVNMNVFFLPILTKKIT